MSYPNLPDLNNYPPPEPYKPAKRVPPPPPVAPPQQQAPQYAPPLHSMPQAPRQPTVFVPSCIPNHSRVNYKLPAVIKCGRNGLVLQANQITPNCPLVIWNKTGEDCQKWFFTEEGRIESAADRTYCLDCTNVQVGAQVVLGKKRLSQTGDEVDPEIVSQKWNVVAHGNLNYIVNVMNPNLVLELAGSTQNYLKGDLVRINSNLSVNNLHQTWTIQPARFSQHHTREEKLIAKNSKIYIYSAETGLYLTVKTSGMMGKAKPGASVIWAKGKLISGLKTQQWVFDEEGFLASALDKNGNLVLDARSGQAGEELIVSAKKYSNNLGQKWIVKQAIAKPTKKNVNLKVCRYFYSQLNTNVIIDEKGLGEPALLNFNRQTGDHAQKLKTKTA